MTHTLPKRTHRMTPAPHTHAASTRLPRHEPFTDPADLARALRTLAIRAHKLLRHSLQKSDESFKDELRELRTALRCLEAELQVQQLHPLVPYVSSLRRQVEMVDC